MEKIERRKNETDENYGWRQGVAFGLQQALQNNEIALRIGNTILEICDRRYEFKKEDY